MMVMLVVLLLLLPVTGHGFRVVVGCHGGNTVGIAGG